eukprot:2097335-Rhodomonas_salina.1
MTENSQSISLISLSAQSVSLCAQSRGFRFLLLGAIFSPGKRLPSRRRKSEHLHFMSSSPPLLHMKCFRRRSCYIMVAGFRTKRWGSGSNSRRSQGSRKLRTENSVRQEHANGKH